MLYRSLIATVLGVSMHDTTYTYNIYIYIYVCVCLYVLMQFLDEHAQPSISGLLPVRLVPRSARERFWLVCARGLLARPCAFSCLSTLFYPVLSSPLYFTLCTASFSYCSTHCSFLCFTLLDSTLLYMYRLTAFKASELRYFRLRCFCTPHLCVGFLVFVSVSRPRPPPVRTTLSRAIFHNTIFHAQLCHTQSFTTQSFTHIVTLSHTIFHNTNFHIVTYLSHTQLCHTQCFTIFPHISPTHNLFTTQPLLHFVAVPVGGWILFCCGCTPVKLGTLPLLTVGCA